MFVVSVGQGVPAQQPEQGQIVNAAVRTLLIHLDARVPEADFSSTWIEVHASEAKIFEGDDAFKSRNIGAKIRLLR